MILNHLNHQCVYKLSRVRKFAERNFRLILINVTVNAGHNTKSKGKLEIICHQFQKNLNSVSRGVELTRKILRSTRVSWHLSHVRNFFDFENVEYASIYIHSPL